MAKSETKTEAYRKYGAKLTNPQWSWSARCSEGVVLTLWSDRFDWKAKPPTYDGAHDGPEDQNQLGNKERLNDLLWARDHHKGQIKVVMAKVGSSDSGRRVIEDCSARPNLPMRLTFLDASTGEFRAEVIESHKAEGS